MTPSPPRCNGREGSLASGSAHRQAAPLPSHSTAPQMPRSFLGLIALLLATSASARRVHTLMPSPSTVAFGYYDAAATPVLRVNSGDEVIVGTEITSSPTRLEQVGVKPADVQASL